MAILDKLIEKKDLIAYLYFKSKAIEKIDIMEVEPKKRQLIKERMFGRLMELELLRININNIKDVSKSLSKKNVTRSVKG